MRELKFRAWDEEHNKFIYFELNQILERRLTDCNDLSSIILKILKCKNKQQFTGLKDKNGKDIYEGDIINHEDDIGFIEFQDAVFVIKFEDESFIPGYNFHIEELEIIGNIYENKELLK